MKILKTIGLVSLCLAPLSCTDSFEGEYSNPNEQIIVNDKWNATDAKKTSEVIIKAVLAKNWLNEFKQSHGGKKPVVIVDEIENRAQGEHVDTQAIGEALQNELINSGAIRFVDKAAREKLVKEIRENEQSGMVDPATGKKRGKRLGADFFLLGTLSSKVEDSPKGNFRMVTYTTTVRLTDLETSEILFSESYDIRKKFKRSGSSF